MHLVPAILGRARTQNASFYVPGHKGNTSKASHLHVLLQRASIGADLTELEGLDNLHNPEGVIAQAQQHASQVFQAGKTFFLVNGTTCGIHAAVIATCNPGTTLLVSRASHSSVFNAAAIAGCHLVTIDPEIDTYSGVALGLRAPAVAGALDDLAASCSSPCVSALLITSPTYHGACSDVQAIAEVCRDRGVYLIVDEAHGAHLGLHPSFPPSAMQTGADIAVQSTHKTLGSLTQSAMLHIAPSATECLGPAVARHLSVFQSTSPSYLLMASLEIAAHAAAQPEAFADAIRAAEHVRSAWRLFGGRTLCDSGVISRCEASEISEMSDAWASVSDEAWSEAEELGSEGRGAGRHNRFDGVVHSLEHAAMGDSDSTTGASARAAPAEQLGRGQGFAKNEAMPHAVSATQHARERMQHTHACCSNGCKPAHRKLASRAESVMAFDPLRVSLLACGPHMSGFELSDALERHGVVAEMATESTVVLALGTGSTLRDAVAAADAFVEVSRVSVAPGDSLRVQAGGGGGSQVAGWREEGRGGGGKAGSVLVGGGVDELIPGEQLRASFEEFAWSGRRQTREENAADADEIRELEDPMEKQADSERDLSVQSALHGEADTKLRKREEKALADSMWTDLNAHQSDHGRSNLISAVGRSGKRGPLLPNAPCSGVPRSREASYRHNAGSANDVAPTGHDSASVGKASGVHPAPVIPADVTGKRGGGTAGGDQGGISAERFERGGRLRLVGSLRGMLEGSVGEEVCWQDAVGRRSAAALAVYPPGVPLLLYGEEIDEAVVSALRRAVRAGARVVGCRGDASMLHVLQEAAEE